jgi:hypothetical protein
VFDEFAFTILSVVSVRFPFRKSVVVNYYPLFFLEHHNGGILLNRDIIDIGRVVAFIGVIPMIIVALMVAASLPPDPSENMNQMLAVSVGPAAFIWLILSPGGLGIRSSWSESRPKDIIKALLIILSGIGVFLLGPYVVLYTDLHDLINQVGAAISIFGGIMIVIGALMKS